MEQGKMAFTAVYLKSNHGYVGFIEELPGVNSKSAAGFRKCSQARKSCGKTSPCPCRAPPKAEASVGAESTSTPCQANQSKQAHEPALEPAVLGEAPMHAAMRPSKKENQKRLDVGSRREQRALRSARSRPTWRSWRARSRRNRFSALKPARSCPESTTPKHPSAARNSCSRSYAAYIKKDSSTKNFAEELFVACLRNEGDMDSVLGHSA